MQKDTRQVNSAIREVKSQKGVQNKTLRKSIYKKGNELGAHTRNVDPRSIGQETSFNIKISDVPKSHFVKNAKFLESYNGGKKNIESLVNIDKKRNLGKIKDSDYLVVHQTKAGDELLSYELGHIGNEKEGSWLAKKINGYKGQKNIIRVKARGVNPDNPTQAYIPKPSIKEAVKNKIDGLAMRKEESNATKRGLGYMKKSWIYKKKKFLKPRKT